MVPIPVSPLQFLCQQRLRYELVQNSLHQDFSIEFDGVVQPCRSGRSDLHLDCVFLQRSASCLLVMVSGHPRGEAWARLDQ